MMPPSQRRIYRTTGVFQRRQLAKACANFGRVVSNEIKRINPRILWVATAAIVLLCALGEIAIVSQRRATLINQPATLQAADLDEIPVATTPEALTEFIAYTSAQPIDHIGRVRLEMEGKLFRVPVGTPVTVLSNGWTSKRIHIRQGEYAGHTGYVPSEWVSR